MTISAAASLLTTANGRGSRDDLEKKLTKAIADYSSGTLSDAEMEKMIKKVTDRQDKWITSADGTNLKKAVGELGNTSKFDPESSTSTYSVDMSSMPSFNVAADAMERAGATASAAIKQAGSVARAVLHRIHPSTPTTP